VGSGIGGEVAPGTVGSAGGGVGAGVGTLMATSITRDQKALSSFNSFSRATLPVLSENKAAPGHVELATKASANEEILMFLLRKIYD
jgi:hypothetical protein